jgi:EamA-like transporter family protein
MLARLNDREGAAATAMPDRFVIDRTGTTATLLSVIGLLVVAAAQVSNMILARAVAGAIPPFAIAFFRWTLIALALSPFVLREVRAGKLNLVGELWPIFLTGFLGMFLCGGPVYAAGETTGAINIALIMSLSPVIVTLIAWLRGLERIKPLQLAGMALALAGALFIIARGDLGTLKTLQLARGDLYVLFAMLGWSGIRCCRCASRPLRVSLRGSACSRRPAPWRPCRLRRGKPHAIPRPCSTRTPLPPICSPASCQGCWPIPASPG